jgi:Domain of unknown function (DUF4105)
VKSAIAVAIALLLFPGAARAEPGAELSVSVLTFGPGDDPFNKFGHNAIWIHDEEEDDDLVYNFGTFEFDSPIIALEFFVGRFTYWLSRERLASEVKSYMRENRSVEMQLLDLTAPEKLALYERLEWNTEPENKHYKYDYYRDNCSTRVRDALDQVTQGRVRAAVRGPGSMTLREHTLRLTADLLPEYVVLDLVMGAAIDQPIDQWEETFLPVKLQEALRRVTVVRDGVEVPLVKTEQVLFHADRPPPRERPPAWTGWMLGAGLGAGASLALLGHAGRTRRIARIALGALLSAIGLTLGFLGCFFLAAWAFTDHRVGYANENVLQCAPLAIALAALGIGVARGRPRATRRAFLLVVACVGLAALGLVLKALPWFRQDNGRIIAVLLPLWVGAAVALDRLRARATTAPTAPPEPGA